MSLKRRCLWKMLTVVCMTAVASAASAQQQPDAADSDAEEGRRFSLEELTERAVKNEALLAEYRAREEQASWDQYKADHVWSPRITSTTALAPVPANADPDQIGENVDEILAFDIGPYVRQNLDIVVPVYTFGRASAARSLADLGMENASVEFENARLDVLYETRRAYYSLRLSKAFQEMLTEGSELIKERLDDMQEARDFGDADFDIKDFRKLQIFNAEVDSRIVDNARLATVARAGLHFLAEIDHEVTIDVSKLQDLDDPPELRERAYYIDQALRHRPQINQLDMAVEARRLEYELEKKNWYPNLAVALSVGIGWSTEQTRRQPVCEVQPGGECVFTDQFFAKPYADPLNSRSVRLGLALRWQINPFQQHADVNKKEAQHQQILAQRRRARQAIELDIRRLYQEAADALSQVEINDRRMQAAERWRNQFGLSRQTVGGDISDAIDPLRAYYEARAKYLEAVYDYLVARADLSRAVGARGIDEEGAVVGE